MATGSKGAHEAFDAMMEASQTEWEQIGYDRCLNDLRKFLALHSSLTESVDDWARMVTSQDSDQYQKLKWAFWVPDDGVHDNDVVRIDDLELQVRTYNVLKRQGIHVIADALGRSLNDFMDFRNFGESSFRDLYRGMAAFGYHPVVKEA